MAQPVRVSVRICQSDIAVRPDEIERRVEAGAPHFLPPFKNVEWQLKVGAGFGQAVPRLSVHVNLPCERGERGEVVLARPCPNPRQPITAIDGSGRTYAEWTAAIVHADLRHSAEHEAAHRGESKQRRSDRR